MLLLFTAFMGCMKLFVFVGAGLYSHYWAYATSEELVTLVKVTALALIAEQVLSYGLLLPPGVLSLSQ